MVPLHQAPGFGAVQALVRAAVLSILLTTTLATLAAILPLRAQLRDEVVTGRREVQRERPAAWRRWYLDVVALVAGAGVFATGAGGRALKVAATAARARRRARRRETNAKRNDEPVWR